MLKVGQPGASDKTVPKTSEPKTPTGKQLSVEELFEGTLLFKCLKSIIQELKMISFE